MRCNKKYAALKLPNAVFITSQSAFFGQQPNTKNQVKLPTIEKHRNSSIEQQAIDILEYTKIQEIFIGNYPASDQELVSLKKYAKHFNRPQSNDSVVKLKAHIIKGLQANETKILAYKNHFRRGDLTEGFIRSTNTRILYRDVKPRGNVKKAQIGDIVIINNNNPHYVGEL
jgi:hypothetical protein